MCKIEMNKQRFLEKHLNLVEPMVQCWDKFPFDEAFYNVSPTRFRRSSDGLSRYFSLYFECLEIGNHF